MLKTGESAPDFALPDATGCIVTLTGLLVNGPLILFFYPADFTPVCTKEACLFRDAWSDLTDQGVTVAGVSPDDVESHARFRNRHSINYPLLADPDKQACHAYQVLGPFGLLRRTTYLVGQNRLIRAAARADLRLSPHNRLLQQALEMV
jgi:peroxiredoxin Q/BCP